MPILKTGYYDCDECGEYFALGDGAVCPACHRVLCNQHMHGTGAWWRKRWPKARCTRCRGGAGISDGPERTP